MSRKAVKCQRPSHGGALLFADMCAYPPKNFSNASRLMR